jgi:hypothetical protein
MKIHRLVAAAAVCVGMTGGGHFVSSAEAFTFFASLAGGHEVSATGGANAGDTNAFGSAAVFIDLPDTICVAILLSGLDTPTTAHVHAGRAGVNGAILITLPAPATGDPGATHGCVTNADSTFQAMLRSINATPSSFYINVHSVEFVDGGVRGQLF